VRAAIFPPDLAAQASWTASSAIAGFQDRGVRPSPKPNAPVFFHTKSDDHPWVRIDLGRPTVLRSIRVDNRTDCCEAGAVPLNVEIPDGSDWRLLCQRRTPFSSWTCRFPAVAVRWFRITFPGTGALQLKGVAAFP
jgi:hypothetical protein